MVTDRGYCSNSEVLLRKNLLLFPSLLDDYLISQITQQAPRALVILAHYVAILSFLERDWLIGRAGVREVHAISNGAGLSERRIRLLEEPVRLVNLILE